MKSKFESYLGFARKSGNLLLGSGACEAAVSKGTAKLIIIAGDTKENTVRKIQGKAKWMNVPCIIASDSETLSRITGAEGRNVYTVTDDNFAKIIAKELSSDN